jgi:uncharacterized protein YbjT (DUF2867 family)
MTTQTVLLAGATGMLGSQIAYQLVDQPDARLRLLVRSSAKARGHAGLQAVIARGAEIVEADLADAASLHRATQGVDVIVSAVQGGPDVIVDGQVALAQAGKRNGVRRMLPSDFALDLFKATPGEHPMFDLRRTADAAIAALGLQHIHVLQGGFMEMFGPGMGAIDDQAGTVSFWGNGSERFPVTSVRDTARMTAHVALDRSVPSGKFAFAGDHVSFLEATDLIETRSGRTFQRRSLGSEDELRAALAKAAHDQTNPFRAVMLAYQLYMLNGQTALSDLHNGRYSGVELETFPEFAVRTLSS